MPVLFALFVLLLGVPLIEIYVLIQVGRAIGAGATILLLILTALAGAWLLRAQGLRTIARVQEALARGELPAQALLEGLVLVLTSVLLLTPGFVTDAIGFLVLLPWVRQALARRLGSSLLGRRVRTPSASATQRTLEGDFRVDPD
jgi:UPF0716 protein FxsA